MYSAILILKQRHEFSRFPGGHGVAARNRVPRKETRQALSRVYRRFTCTFNASWIMQKSSML